MIHTEAVTFHLLCTFQAQSSFMLAGIKLKAVQTEPLLLDESKNQPFVLNDDKRWRSPAKPLQAPAGTKVTESGFIVQKRLLRKRSEGGLLKHATLNIDKFISEASAARPPQTL